MAGGIGVVVLILLRVRCALGTQREQDTRRSKCHRHEQETQAVR